MNPSTKPLTPEESAHLESSPSCGCGHREVFHQYPDQYLNSDEDEGPYQCCQISDCNCPDFNQSFELPELPDSMTRVQHLQRWRSMIEAQLPDAPPDNSEFTDQDGSGSIEYDWGSDRMVFQYSSDEVFLSWCLVNRITREEVRPLNSSGSGEQWVRDFIAKGP